MMPALSLLTDWAVAPSSLELMIWWLCGLCALLLAAALAALGAEVRWMLREPAAPIPAREFQGFGRPAPRVSAPAPRSGWPIPD